MAFRINGDLSTCVCTTADEILQLIRPAKMVVVERFATSGRLSAPGLDTITIVGIIMGWCKAFGIPYELVIPQNRYSFMKEAQGAVGGLIERSDWARHEVDALAHLLAWEYRDKRNPHPAKR